MNLRLVNRNKDRIYRINADGKSPIKLDETICGTEAQNQAISLLFSEVFLDIMDGDSPDPSIGIAFDSKFMCFRITPKRGSDLPSVRADITTRDKRSLGCIAAQGKSEPDDRFFVGETLTVVAKAGTFIFEVVDGDRRGGGEWLYSRQTGQYLRPSNDPKSSNSPGEMFYIVDNERTVGASAGSEYGEVRRLIWRDGEAYEAFQTRAARFTERAKMLESHQLGDFVPEIVDNGSLRVYREPFVLTRNRKSGRGHRDDLHQFVEQIRKSPAPSSPQSCMDYAVAWSVLTQIGEILRNLKVGHGTLTPKNILIRQKTSDGQIQVAVRGFAYDDPKLEVTQGFFLTDPTVDERKDWVSRDNFALGSLLYFMLIGHPPPGLCSKANLETWREERIRDVECVDQSHGIPHGVPIGEITDFLRAAWQLNGKEQTLDGLLGKLRDPKLLQPRLPAFILPVSIKPIGWKPFMMQMLIVALIPIGSLLLWAGSPRPPGVEIWEWIKNLPTQVAVVHTSTPPVTLSVTPKLIVTQTSTSTPVFTDVPLTRQPVPPSPAPGPTITHQPAPTTPPPTRANTPTPTTPSPPLSPAPVPAAKAGATSTSRPWPVGCSEYAHISSPVDGDELEGNTLVKGSAFAAEGDVTAFEHFELSYRGEYEDATKPESWHTIEAPKKQVRNSVLGEFAPINMRGIYYLRLRIVATSGHYTLEGYKDCIIKIMVK